MIVPVLILLLGTSAMATPARTPGEAGEEEVFEGDMILSPEQKEMLKKSLIKTDDDQAKADEEAEKEKELLTAEGEEGGKSFFHNQGYVDIRWPGNTLYYDLSEFSSWTPVTSCLRKRKIRNALKTLQEKLGNCVKFKERESGYRVVVHTHGSEGCFSQVGYQGVFQEKEQKLNLGSGCRETGIIQHEFIHALGFLHMQMRSDRDKYVTILKQNIPTRVMGNFEKYGPSMIKHFGLPFDYGSIMMYGGSAFGSGRMTIKATDPKKQKVMGQRKGPSAGDIKMIRIAYGCEKP